MLLLAQVSPCAKSTEQKIVHSTHTSLIFYAIAIDIPKEGENVKQESVDKWHAIFLEELELLFERHKCGAGYGDRQLRML